MMISDFMMIGGCDITLRSSYLTEDLIHHAAVAILGIWKHGVIEDANSENKFLQPKDLFGGVYKEIFIFKNLSSQRSWTEHGWTDGNCKSMIHLLSEVLTGELTCVVEDPKDPELERIIEAITLAISKPIIQPSTKTAYTLGRGMAYDQALKEPDGTKKLGQRLDRDPPYAGGWVWLSWTAAENFRLHGMQSETGWNPPDFAVYELELPNGWDKDVSPTPLGSGAHLLLNDAQIIRRVASDPDGEKYVRA